MFLPWINWLINLTGFWATLKTASASGLLVQLLLLLYSFFHITGFDCLPCLATRVRGKSCSQDCHSDTPTAGLFICFLVCQQCKEWGFCLRDLFGLGLGTGDYGHLTVEHASMLLRKFRSLRHYSNQGFEASHKLQKQIYSRATNHDGSGEATSCK